MTPASIFNLYFLSFVCCEYTFIQITVFRMCSFNHRTHWGPGERLRQNIIRSQCTSIYSFTCWIFPAENESGFKLAQVWRNFRLFADCSASNLSCSCSTKPKINRAAGVHLLSKLHSSMPIVPRAWVLCLLFF